MRRASLMGLILGAWLVAMPGVAFALDVDLELESVTIDPASREVVLSGTVTCDAGATLLIGFAVTQGRATAGGNDTMTCSGTEQIWELREPLGIPRLHPGPAILQFGFLATLGEASLASGRNVEAFLAPAAAPWLFSMEQPG